MSEWLWVKTSTVLAIHDRQLSIHGGLDGVRDMNAVESALARPQHIAVYETPDAADLAAAYAFGLAKNHGFSDGNKRTAWVVARVFVADNGFLLPHSVFESIRLMEDVAGGQVSEAALAVWFRERARRR